MQSPASDVGRGNLRGGATRPAAARAVRLRRRDDTLRSPRTGRTPGAASFLLVGDPGALSPSLFLPFLSSFLPSPSFYPSFLPSLFLPSYPLRPSVLLFPLSLPLFPSFLPSLPSLSPPSTYPSLSSLPPPLSPPSLCTCTSVQDAQKRGRDADQALFQNRPGDTLFHSPTISNQSTPFDSHPLPRLVTWGSGGWEMLGGGERGRKGRKKGEGENGRKYLQIGWVCAPSPASERK